MEETNTTEEKIEETPKPKRIKKKETQGVVLMAFGKMGYYYASFNMAMSLKKFNPNLKITLIHDGGLKDLMHVGFFDNVVKIKPEDLYTDGRLSPARAKIALYKYLPYDHNLYLDVDGIALQDVTPLLEECKGMEKPYITEVRGVGKKGETINYAIWAEHKDIWSFFNLDKDSEYPAIQSSFCYIKKGKEAKKIFDTALRYYKKGFPIDKLTMQWGMTIPDELIFSGTCAKLGYNPNYGGYPIFFGWKHTDLSYSQIQERYYVLSLYGNGTGSTLTKGKYIEWYDRLFKGYSREMRTPPHYKAVYIMRDKHANIRK